MRTVVTCENRLTREALCGLLDGTAFEVVAQLPGLAALLEQGEPEHEADLVLAYARACDTDFVDALRRLSAWKRVPKIVVLGGTTEPSSIASVFAAGANGLLNEDMSPEALAASLQLACMGERVLSSKAVSSVLLSYPFNGPTSANCNVRCADLSGREREILELLAAGLTNKVIGRRLDIAEATVKVNVKSILRKLGVANRTQAAIWTLNNGSPPSGDMPLSACPRRW